MVRFQTLIKNKHNSAASLSTSYPRALNALHIFCPNCLNVFTTKFTKQYHLTHHFQNKKKSFNAPTNFQKVSLSQCLKKK